MKHVSVSSLVEQIKNFLEAKVHLENFMISGELSNVRKVNGHYYFNLKDDRAQMSCTLWKTYAMNLPFALEDGQAVQVHGSLGIYTQRGTMQLNCDRVELAGLGALYQELERRKQLLASQGYFNPAHKKPMPSVIERIGIVTGASTAALQDALKTIHTRWPMLEVHLFPASVQGEQAPPTIIRALKQADQAGLDAVLLIRGGGSFEDLFCFNDPEIVRTLYEMQTYTVTGIGHQIDTSLADLAADHHSLTPTAAAQWITPDQNEIRSWLQSADVSMANAMKNLFASSSQRLLYLLSNPYLSSPRSWLESRRQKYSMLAGMLEHQAGQLCLRQEQLCARMNSLLQEALSDRLDASRRSALLMQNRLYMASPKSRLEKYRERILYMEPAMKQAVVRIDESAGLRAARAQQSLSLLASSFAELQRRTIENDVRRLKQSSENLLSIQKRHLSSLSSMLSMVSWQNVLDRGFSIILQDGHPVRDASALKPGMTVQAEFARGSASMHVESVSACHCLSCDDGEDSPQTQAAVQTEKDEQALKKK